jgi:hypothetical protein
VTHEQQPATERKQAILNEELNLAIALRAYGCNVDRIMANLNKKRLIT